MRVDEVIGTVEFHETGLTVVVEREDADKALGHPLGEYGGLADDVWHLAEMVYQCNDAPFWFDPEMDHHMDGDAVAWTMPEREEESW